MHVRSLGLSYNFFEMLNEKVSKFRFDYLSRDIKSRAILIAMFVGGFLVPFILVIVFYLLVLKSIKSKGRSLRTLFESEEINKLSPPPTPNSLLKNNRSHTLTTTSDLQASSLVNRNSQRIQSLISEIEDTNNAPSGGINSHLRSAIVKREFEATKSVAMCVGFFFLAWFPNALIVVISQFGVNIEDYVTPLTASMPPILAKTSTIFNPLVYTLMNSEFKIYFKRVLGINKRQRNNTIDLV